MTAAAVPAPAVNPALLIDAYQLDHHHHHLSTSSCAGETLNINADVAARELAIALRPMRVVFISAGGGWKEDGKVVPSVNMAVDYPVWVRRDYTGRQVS